ncbi:hypothetical protein HK100_011059 [Physocladia obscura]|uniref:Kinase n=1 Tax=Physocladia obscura TaxID=109957 RepID=A0AAD5XEE9_9FUNG|nr:hypothetical protein HK100_011059 [Physocladia obscura]
MEWRNEESEAVIKLELFEHQVAGHAQSLWRVVERVTAARGYDTVTVDSGIVDAHTDNNADNGGTRTELETCLLAKQLQPVEAAFYVASQAVPSTLTPFLPAFHGVYTARIPPNLNATNNRGDGVRFAKVLVIQNTIAHLPKPSVADIKLGTRLFGPDANAEKIGRMISHAKNTTSGAVGLRICGLKVYCQNQNSSFSSYTVASREFGRSLTPESLPSGFAQFFAEIGNQDIRTLLIRRFLFKISVLLDALKQTECRLYGASLLLAFDNSCLTASTPVKSIDPFIVVRLIDFAHSFYCPGNGYDEGAIFATTVRTRFLKPLPIGIVYKDPRNQHTYKVIEKRINTTFSKYGAPYLGPTEPALIDVPDKWMKMTNPQQANINQ